MTRGKYAARATNRREVAEVEASEAAYQRQIVRLTQERNQARESLADVQKKAAVEARALRAQITEGTSAQVEALRISLNKLRDERDAANRTVQRWRKGNTAALHRLMDHMVDEHGIASGRDAYELAARFLVPDLGMVTFGNEKHLAKAAGPEAVRQLRKAKGSDQRLGGRDVYIQGNGQTAYREADS